MKSGRYPKKPNPRRKYADARFEVCKVCGLDWNVSKLAVIDRRGYLCPKCRRKGGRQKS